MVFIPQWRSHIHDTLDQFTFDVRRHSGVTPLEFVSREAVATEKH
jgi:hypothetical protein